jgi:hypothetical protein
MPSSSASLSLTLALLLCSLCAGCGAKIAESLSAVSKLQAAIVKEYGEDGVNVNLHNSSSLTVTFINSPLNAKGRQDRAKRAVQTAEFVRTHYPLILGIAEIWVSFVRVETRYFIVHYSEGLDVFGFDKNARPMTRPTEGQRASAPDDSLRPIAVYSPNLKQTEVRITSLLLQGDFNEGLAVIPHFTVPGDATGVRRSSSFPETVGFDFASYSAKSLFPGESRIKFLADGKVVFETSGTFSTSTQSDGLVSAFLFIKVPYPAFRLMTAGKTLTFMLGEHEYSLTDEQIEALRGMTQYVGE